MRANVVFRPRSVSPKARYRPPAPPGCGAVWTAMTSPPGVQGMWALRALGSVGHDEDDRRDQRVQGRQRQEHLPAEAHELVVAQARERRADPEEEEDQEAHLRQDHERVDPV